MSRADRLRAGPGADRGRHPLRGGGTVEDQPAVRGPVETDARDALLLARLLRLDDIVAVRVPTVTQEAARDLVRAREDARADLMRIRHRISKLLLRHGHVYFGGAAWPGKHEQWLRGIGFDGPERAGTAAAFDA